MFKLEMKDGENAVPCMVVLSLNMFDMNAE
jgi:hypothetical protein